MIKRQRVTDYWVVMFDRDGGEDNPEGPFDFDDALDHAGSMLDEWRWVSYEIQEGDD